MYKKLTLPNGAELILNPMHETQAVTVLVLFKVGSRYESKRLNGISHFIEHLFYKGTKKRPSTLAISKELDSIGADYNAYTAKDHTGYYIKVYYKKLEKALDILSDVIFNAKFDAGEIEREKNVIIEEINMYEDNPLLYIEDLFERTLYGSNSLGRLISGAKENVRSFKRTDVLRFKESFYEPANMVLSLAGRYEEGRIVDLINKYFGNDNKKKKFPPFKTIGIEQEKPRISLKERKTEQVQLAMGFPAISYFHKDLYVLYLLCVILGGSMSSRLFINIREKKGLCYFIKMAPNIYQDTGSVYIQAGLDKKRIFEAIELIWQELKIIKKDLVKTAELKKAKDYLKGKMVLELEESNEISSFYANQQLLIGKIETPEQKFKKIDQVSPEDIRRVSRKILQKKFINLVLIGPQADKKPLRAFIDRKLK